MSPGFGGLSVTIHAGGVALLLLVPFATQAQLPEPRSMTDPVDVLPLVVAHAGRSQTRPAPPRPAVQSKTNLAARAPVPPPLRTIDAAPSSEAAGERACSGCVLGATDDGLAEVAGDGAGASRTGDEAASSATPPALVRVSAGVEAPRKLVHVDPIYPELARRAGVQGIVRLECTIDPAGHVAAIVVKGGHPLLVPAAESAVRQWRYTPTRLNGVPVAVIMTVTVAFTLAR